VPSLSITLPAMLLTLFVSIVIALVSSYYRGRLPDRVMMVAAVLGMSVSFLVYIIFGQYWGAYELNERLDGELFAIQGYEPGLSNWVHYCMLPVLISTVVAMGYDTRFYRAVMVEESGRDYIVTARAKGASKRKIMFVHMLKNAMIPIVTRVMITLPFLIMGSLLLEVYFGIPGMGRALYDSIVNSDFPVAQTLVAIFAGVFILSVILTDVLYALVDPRVRLS
jgi:peptide/nickel transport system permease protein